MAHTDTQLPHLERGREQRGVVAAAALLRAVRGAQHDVPADLPQHLCERICERRREE